MFDNGSEILRFDCHLHTIKDKEFNYSGEDNCVCQFKDN